MIYDVQRFHKKFGLPDGGALDNLIDIMHDSELQNFRVKFIQEELDELKLAFSEKNKVGVFDALIDICYVALGTALFAGITSEQWKQGWNAVQNCNMQKTRAKNAGESKRNSQFDIVKPKGWQGPEKQLAEILNITAGGENDRA